MGMDSGILECKIFTCPKDGGIRADASLHRGSYPGSNVANRKIIITSKLFFRSNTSSTDVVSSICAPWRSIAEVAMAHWRPARWLRSSLSLFWVLY